MDLDTLPFYVYLLPVFWIFIAIEVVWRRRRGKSYAWKAAFGSIVVFIGHISSGIAEQICTGPIWVSALANSVSIIDHDAWWSWVLVFIGVEFAYYWQHRWSHAIRWVWATHAVHHSSNDLTFMAAARLPWTSAISGQFLVWIPLVLLGFPPERVGLFAGLNLSYQFFIHTEMFPRLGFLEWFLNTPSHHRVHHATNECYVDRNFGGVLIIFDRLFGTFVEERQDVPCRYGLTPPLLSANPVRIAFNEWINLFRDVARARTWRQRLVAAFGSPQ